LPSTAFEAGYEALWTEEAVAGRPCDNNVDAPLARLAGPAAQARAAMSATTTPRIQARGRANDRNACAEPVPMTKLLPVKKPVPVTLEKVCSILF
jgi:hypothetical protein